MNNPESTFDEADELFERWVLTIDGTEDEEADDDDDDVDG